MKDIDRREQPMLRTFRKEAELKAQLEHVHRHDADPHIFPPHRIALVHISPLPLADAVISGETGGCAFSLQTVVEAHVPICSSS